MLVRLGYQMRNVDYTFQVICVADIEIREWLLASLLLLSKPAEQFPKLHFALFSLGLHAVVESELEKNRPVFSQTPSDLHYGHFLLDPIIIWITIYLS